MHWIHLTQDKDERWTLWT